MGETPIAALYAVISRLIVLHLAVVFLVFDLFDDPPLAYSLPTTVLFRTLSVLRLDYVCHLRELDPFSAAHVYFEGGGW